MTDIYDRLDDHGIYPTKSKLTEEEKRTLEISLEVLDHLNEIRLICTDYMRNFVRPSNDALKLFAELERIASEFHRQQQKGDGA
jgi:hypothetical protein